MRRSISIILVLIVMIGLAACSSGPQIAFEDLPAGNANDGRLIFSEKIGGSMACSNCHRLDDVDSTGPSLAGYSEIADTRVSGQSAAEYTFNSIVSPGKYIVTGFNNNMERGYDKNLSPQQIADLIAFMLQN